VRRIAGSRVRAGIALAVLLFCDWWLASTIYNATSGAERGEGAAFWSAIVVIALLLAGLLALTLRVLRMLRSPPPS
jgi:hypothetical protein